MMKDNREFMNAYIQFSLLPSLIHDANYSGARAFTGLFRDNLQRLYRVNDAGADAKLAQIQSMLADDDHITDILAEVNKINSWLASGAKSQMLGVVSD